ncbi:hypothetical protein GHT09_010596 [Marmota monax]|uniref:Aspartic peptidase N-terminal domain-containing protein n=1 Tax=Marmota monax TaxID=9995 RepID=A0A834PMQ1_MARMO|nr:hypothetical protein GHT09_010596 [Marmota monax]
MKWMVVALVCLLAFEASTTLVRVPLRKMKTMRQTMKEKGLLGDFLKTHKYDLAQKYRFSDFSVLYEPITYMDSCQPGPPCCEWPNGQSMGRAPADLAAEPQRPRGSPGQAGTEASVSGTLAFGGT